MKKFDFYKDEKHTIWWRGKFQVEAETYEEAVNKVKEMEDDPVKYDEVDVRWEDMPETTTELTPEDNDWFSTIEIYSEDTNDLIFANGKENIDPIKI